MISRANLWGSASWTFDSTKPWTEIEPLSWIQSSGVLERQILKVVSSDDLRRTLDTYDVFVEETDLEVLARLCQVAMCKDSPLAYDAARRSAECHIDVWANPVLYEHDIANKTVSLRSRGPDGALGTADDIVVKDDGW